MCNRSPLCCFTPPHLLKEISQRGNAQQKQWALHALTVSERQRGHRDAMTALPTPEAWAHAEKHRVVHDAQHRESTMLVRKVWEEGDRPTNDCAIDEAVTGLGAAYDLYKEVFGRNSIDGRGMILKAIVHFGWRYPNAFWDGRQMVFGDGDGEIFSRFTRAIDIIGHELTHGVIHHTANLEYRNQPGALNESFADVFGSLVKQRLRNQAAAEADWLIGEGIFMPGIQGSAIRSMKAPGTAYDDPRLGRDPQPAHMRDYREMTEDNGGVHINSGIPNHAFYRVAVEIGGYAWEKAGLIWYVAMTRLLRSDSDFQDAANSTFLVAGELYGRDSLEQKAVQRGWSEVGINVEYVPIGALLTRTLPAAAVPMYSR